MLTILKFKFTTKSVEMLSIKTTEASAILKVRLDILRKGMTLDDCQFSGDNDPESIHFAALDNDKIIGCCTLTVNPQSVIKNSYYQLRGMAVLDNYRGTGVGQKLLYAAEAELVELGNKVLWFNARTSAVGFYQKYGYQVLGNEFVIEGVGPHYKMYKAIS
jgi:predicted GNAT family N-acyltransferase